MTELVTMSSKGQIVIPKEVREQHDLHKGSAFAVFGNEGTLILKKVDVPSAQEAFEQVHRWGVNFAKKKGLKEEDVERVIHEGRGIHRGKG